MVDTGGAAERGGAAEKSQDAASMPVRISKIRGSSRGVPGCGINTREGQSDRGTRQGAGGTVGGGSMKHEGLSEA